MKKKMDTKLTELSKKYECYWDISFKVSQTYTHYEIYCGNWDYSRKRFNSLKELENEIDNLLEHTDKTLYREIENDLQEKINSNKERLLELKTKLKKVQKGNKILKSRF